MLAGGLSGRAVGDGLPGPAACRHAGHGRSRRKRWSRDAPGHPRRGNRGRPVLAAMTRTLLAAGAILVAAGPWSADLLDPTGAWRPIRPTYGVTVQVALAPTPTSVLEEGAVHTVNRPVAEDEPADGLFTFSMVTAGGVSTVSSTFLPAAPDPGALAQQLVAHGARFVPALAGAAIVQRPGHRAPAVGRRAPVHRAGWRPRWRLRNRRARAVGNQHRTGLRLADRRQHRGRGANSARTRGNPPH